MTSTPEQMLAKLQRMESAAALLPQTVTAAAKSSLQNVHGPGIRIGVSRKEATTRVLVRSSNPKAPAAAVARAIKPKVVKAMGKAIREALRD